MDTPEKAAIAHHEAGHAVAAVLAFRMAEWLPMPRPPVLVRRVEIMEDAGKWTGNCTATSVYSTKWPKHRIVARYRPLMEAQIGIHLGGGIAEAAHRGERRKDEILKFAMDHCEMDADLTRARVVLADLNSLGRKYDEQFFAKRTRTLLVMVWPSVEALAMELLDKGVVEGARVEEIVISAMQREYEAARPLASRAGRSRRSSSRRLRT